jgi:hypothetical protein
VQVLELFQEVVFETEGHGFGYQLSAVSYQL